MINLTQICILYHLNRLYLPIMCYTMSKVNILVRFNLKFYFNIIYVLYEPNTVHELFH